MEPYPGAEVGAYRIERKVGEGAFGAVWCGAHVETGQRVALKVLLAAAAANPEQVSRFDREAKLLGLVQSPHVARMVEVLVSPSFGVVLVMELIDGELMSDLLSAGLVSVDDVIDIGAQILEGVADLHAVGIIHRDLKPNNIMLCSKADGTRRVVIFDLGLSRIVRDVKAEASTRSLTGSHVALGTLECMAPEQILNARDVTERSDLYAVGSILYRAMTGSYPFSTADDERDLARKKLTIETPEIVIAPTDVIAEGLRTVVTKATRRRPSQRYASAREMRDDLVALQAMSRGRKAAAAAQQPASPARDAERAYRARMPTLDLEAEPTAPAATRGGARLPLVVGVTVFTLVVGGALAWHALHP